MARKMTEYRSLDFKAPVRIVQGIPKQDCIEAVQGRRIIRITEDNRDDVAITGPMIPEGTEVPWHNVAGGVRDVGPKDNA